MDDPRLAPPEGGPAAAANQPALPARAYSLLELRVDGAIHALGIGAAVVGGTTLLLLAAMRGGASEITVAAIYLSGLLAMFGCSAAYNLWHSSRWRPLLQGLDHSAIFLMIAGSYTPFTVLMLEGAWATAITATVWGVALGGIAIRLWLPGVFRRSRLALYLALGWIGVVAIGPFTGVLDSSTLILLGVGGALYTTGIIFHLWSALPFQNAIWHGFVLAGASVHYAAIVHGVIVSADQMPVVSLVLS